MLKRIGIRKRFVLGACMDDVFPEGFPEYWSYAKHLTDKQRQTILRSLPKSQRDKLERDYVEGGWEDLFLRNQLDELLDEINAEFGIDLLNLRMAVIEGKSVYVKKKFWEHVNKRFKGYSARHIYYIFGSFRAVEAPDSDEYRLVPLEGQ